MRELRILINNSKIEILKDCGKNTSLKKEYSSTKDVFDLNRISTEISKLESKAKKEVIEMRNQFKEYFTLCERDNLKEEERRIFNKLENVIMDFEFPSSEDFSTNKHRSKIFWEAWDLYILECLLKLEYSDIIENIRDCLNKDESTTICSKANLKEYLIKLRKESLNSKICLFSHSFYYETLKNLAPNNSTEVLNWIKEHETELEEKIEKRLKEIEKKHKEIEEKRRKVLKENRIDINFSPRGFNNERYDYIKKEILKNEYGIEWYTFRECNPHIIT